jgi:hypothetical protein
MSLDRNVMAREIARLRHENAALTRRNEALDLQRLLLLDQVIAMQAAADEAGLSFDFTAIQEAA